MVVSFRAHNFQKFRKFHELPRNLLHLKPITPTHPGGEGGEVGSEIGREGGRRGGTEEGRDGEREPERIRVPIYNIIFVSTC